MEPAKFVEEMERILDESGWIQGFLGDEETGYCLIGAFYTVDAASFNHGFNVAVLETLSDQILKYAGERFIINFNDNENTTYEDIKLVLKHTKEELTK